MGKAVVQLRKQENNCFRLQYNLVVTSKLIFEWDMADLILTCTVCIPPTLKCHYDQILDIHFLRFRKQ